MACVKCGIRIVREHNGTILGSDSAKCTRRLSSARPEIVDADNDQLLATDPYPFMLISEYARTGVAQGVCDNADRRPVVMISRDGE